MANKHTILFILEIIIVNLTHLFRKQPWCSGLALGLQRVWSLSLGLVAIISEIGYLLLQSSDMAELLSKERKSSKQPTYLFYNLAYNEMKSLMVWRLKMFSGVGPESG